MKWALSGVEGRMGQAVLSLLDSQDFVYSCIRDPHKPLPTSLASIRACSDWDAVGEHAECWIDFSSPALACQIIPIAQARAVPLLVGTTGLSAEDHAALAGAAQHIPVLYSANMSLGVHVLRQLVRQAAQLLPTVDYDVEIIEVHHRHKIDAPSGTALRLGEDVACARGQDLQEQMRLQGAGLLGPRPTGSIGFSAIRGGSVVGDHDVMFVGAQETLVLRHHAQSRDVFAAGALHAARWLCRQAPGLYGMEDVLSPV